MRGQRRYGVFAPSLIVLATACAGLSWCWFALQRGLISNPLEDMAGKIILGGKFESRTLELVLGRAGEEGLCHLVVMRQRLVIAVEILNRAVESAAIERVDADADRVAAEADRLLNCSPRESFGWFARFWIESRREGLNDAALEALRRSYQNGRREAWIGLRRNRIALAIYNFLPPDLQAESLQEFRSLMLAYLTAAAVDSFVQVKPETRSVLMREVDSLPRAIRQQFMAELKGRRSLPFDPSLYEKPAERPWQ